MAHQAKRTHKTPTKISSVLIENFFNIRDTTEFLFAPMRDGGLVTVVARRSDAAEADAFLTLIVSDTGSGWSGGSAREPRSGVGLENIESRLRHYFGASAAMAIRPTTGGGTTVELCLPLVGDRALAAAS